MAKQYLVLIIATLLAVITPLLPVSAEQALAETYRQMFKSGNFYVEFQMSLDKLSKINFYSVTLAGKNGMRMQRKISEGNYGEKGDEYLEGTEVSVIYTGIPQRKQRHLISRHSSYQPFSTNQYASDKDWMDVLYKNGKYYRLTVAKIYKGGLFGMDSSTRGKVKELNAKVLDEKYLHSNFLNPNEEWDFVRKDLALPDELAIFHWNEPMRDNHLNLQVPKFNMSSEKNIGDKNYICDEYVIDIKNLNGEIIAQNIYNVLYYDGKIELIQTYFQRGGISKLIREVKIKKITSEVPDSLFTTGKKVNVYAAEIGDINDLLDNPLLVETWEAKK